MTKINKIKPVYNITKIDSHDAESFLNLQKKLDQETDFMLLYPEERNLDVAVLRAKILNNNNSGDGLFVAQEDGEFVGYIIALKGKTIKNRHSAYIAMGVLKIASGQGIGQSLLGKVDYWALQNNITRLELTVMAHNIRAQGLYQKMGFQIEGVKRKSLKDLEGNYIDELFMSKLTV